MSGLTGGRVENKSESSKNENVRGFEGKGGGLSV